jgi:hypothetical protein
VLIAVKAGQDLDVVLEDFARIPASIYLAIGANVMPLDDVKLIDGPDVTDAEIYQARRIKGRDCLARGLNPAAGTRQGAESSGILGLARAVQLFPRRRLVGLYGQAAQQATNLAGELTRLRLCLVARAESAIGSPVIRAGIAISRRKSAYWSTSYSRRRSATPAKGSQYFRSGQ